MAFEQIQQGDDPRKDWRKINTALSELDRLQPEMRRLRETVAVLQRRIDTPARRDPFWIYREPNTIRTTPTDDWWHLFYVRHGYVFGRAGKVKCDGCDDADSEGTTPTEIDVAADTDEYWVWVESTLNSDGEVTAAEIKHAADPTTNGWTNYPVPISDDGEKVFTLVGKISTGATAADDAEVRQYIRADLQLASVGGDARWG